MLDTTERIKTPIIRDKAFAKRLEKACEGNPNCPTDQSRGKQKWLYDNLLSEFGIRVSPEAVRKWFAGESRPRPKIMSYVARLLEVDEAWLSLGLAPDLTPVERKRHNAMASGAINLVAGIIQLGGVAVFPACQRVGRLLVFLKPRIVTSAFEASGSNGFPFALPTDLVEGVGASSTKSFRGN